MKIGNLTITIEKSWVTPKKSPDTGRESEGWLIPVKPKTEVKDIAQKFDAILGNEISKFAKERKFKSRPYQSLSFDSANGARIVLATLPREKDCFSILTWARKCVAGFKLNHAKILRVDLDTGLKDSDRPAAALIDALVSAIGTSGFKPTRYKKSRPKEKTDSLTSPHEISFVTEQSEEELFQIAQSSWFCAEATNLVRNLALRAGNDLTPSKYVETATTIAKSFGLKTFFYGKEELKKMKAGAFLAVSQGSVDPKCGVLELSFKSKKASLPHIALVGKGITFDTGGTNIKTGGHLLGMNEDMTGSAVVLALLCLAAQEQWPINVTGYLAITDNAIGPLSYRPNDVITTAKGLTIEIIDTDAEGRMVLSDTLHLAGQQNPTLMMDFATLTGSCIRALGKGYSGVFTNRRQLTSLLIRSGRQSGERVWPFPNDPDFGDALKSEIADIKQCRPAGGPDHIEAAHLLKQFVPAKIPWVHVDLSAHDHEGGLAHVPTKTTGFGVRFAKQFIFNFLEKQSRR